MRRYPHVLFSRARRSTSSRIDRTVDGRPTRFGRELRAWRAGDQVTVPVQHRVRTYHQPYTMQNIAGKPVEQGRQEGPVSGSEPDPVTLAVELPFEDRDLVAQGQDLHVLGPLAHRQQS
jgi:hypothetical protein